MLYFIKTHHTSYEKYPLHRYKSDTADSEIAYTLAPVETSQARRIGKHEYLYWREKDNNFLVWTCLR